MFLNKNTNIDKIFGVSQISCSAVVCIHCHTNFSSIIGTSVSKIWLCSVLTDWEYQQESLYCYIFRILNRQDGFCQMLRVAHTVSARLRGIVELSAEAVQLHSTLSERLDDLLVEKDCDERERKKQLTERLDEIYQTNESPCDQCLAFHFGLTESEGESDNEISEAKNDSTQSPLPIEYCYCNCHDAQDRLLIYAIGSEQFPPHVVAFKIIDAKMISRKLKGIEDVVPPSSSNVSREPAENLDNVLAQIEALLSSLDKPDYLIDMRAYIMGLSLSDDEKFVFLC
ncbi:hypothetical protein AB6A40_007223 [Gnathostoma spinigerum]|uniref:Uncharacterized protein n=1 Tax=Gnathostoma spinigerum TaxID=75299 RepID=A0ABD6EQR0_9BILA